MFWLVFRFLSFCDGFSYVLDLNMKDLLCGCLTILLFLLVAGLEFLWKGKNWVAKHMKFFLLTS